MEPMTLTEFVLKFGPAVDITSKIGLCRDSEAMIMASNGDIEACWLERDGVLIWCPLENGCWMPPEAKEGTELIDGKWVVKS